jgi:hypothetical protein
LIQHIERLDPKAIPGQSDTTPFEIYGAERELAVQPGKNVKAPPVECVQERLRVARRGVADVAEIGTQLLVIEDFPVEAEPQGPIGMEHRLVGTFADIDDREASVDKTDILDHHDITVIRTTMNQGFSHGDQRVGRRRVSGPCYTTGDATHRGR